MTERLHRGFVFDSPAQAPPSFHPIPEVGEQVADTGNLGCRTVMHNIGAGSWIAAMAPAISTNVVALFLAYPSAAP
jgi:hypothetical protein